MSELGDRLKARAKEHALRWNEVGLENLLELFAVEVLRGFRDELPTMFDDRMIGSIVSELDCLADELDAE